MQHPESNQRQMEESKKDREIISSSKNNWFCPECGNKNNGNFCFECGTKRPPSNKCSNCGFEPKGKIPNFCPECGNKF